MANTYTGITIAPYPSGAADPQLTISASVNGVPVSVNVWKSVYIANSLTAISFQNWIQPLLLAAYNALQTTTPTPPITSFTV